MFHDIIYWILGISFDCLTVMHVLTEPRETSLVFSLWYWYDHISFFKHNKVSNEHLTQQHLTTRNQQT